MAKKVNGMERDTYIGKYRDTDQKILAGRLFDKCYELQELKSKYDKLRSEPIEIYTVKEANERLKSLFESYGYKPTRYIVSYIVRGCEYKDMTGHSNDACDHYCDECPNYYEDKCVGTFGFYDFNISKGILDAIDINFDAVDMEVTQVKEEKTGNVIWKKGRK